MTPSLDVTYCASPSCRNECGRKLPVHIADCARAEWGLSMAYLCDDAGNALHPGCGWTVDDCDGFTVRWCSNRAVYSTANRKRFVCDGHVVVAKDCGPWYPLPASEPPQ
jgi:hypothetical protein